MTEVILLYRTYNIWLLGGDQRQLHLARLLGEDGHSIHLYGLDTPNSEENLSQIHRADCVIFPLPVADEDLNLTTPLSHLHIPLKTILPQLSPSQFLCGGRVSPVLQPLFQAHNLVIQDYFTQEELIISNAIPTAEGAIQIAMEQLPITIHDAKVLILGFGRVGQATARRFAALGAEVTAAARNHAQLALAHSMGLKTQPLSPLAGWLCGYDLIINTIPAPVLGAKELSDTREDCLILDLASLPGGVDSSVAHTYKRTLIHALGLPGTVAPATAGKAIQHTIYHMLSDAGF